MVFDITSAEERERILKMLLSLLEGKHFSRTRVVIGVFYFRACNILKKLKLFDFIYFIKEL